MTKRKAKTAAKPTAKPTRISGPAPSTAIDARFSVEIPAGVFKNTCLSLMDDVRGGHKEIVITKHGQPVAKLVAADVALPTGFGFLRGTVIGQGDLVGPEWDAWGDLE
ncbi:MAG: type II toxin-antitoxin system prevent-host-death family antitoxin [Gemmatimonadaceae bacterium]